MVHSHILQHKDYYNVHSFICVLFYNKNKWVRAENNSETKKCTKSCDEISIAIPKIVDGKKNQVNFTDSGMILIIGGFVVIYFKNRYTKGKTWYSGFPWEVWHIWQEQ